MATESVELTQARTPPTESTPNELEQKEQAEQSLRCTIYETAWSIKRFFAETTAWSNMIDNAPKGMEVRKNEHYRPIDEIIEQGIREFQQEYPDIHVSFVPRERVDLNDILDFLKEKNKEILKAAIPEVTIHRGNPVDKDITTRSKRNSSPVTYQIKSELVKYLLDHKKYSAAVALDFVTTYLDINPEDRTPSNELPEEPPEVSFYHIRTTQLAGESQDDIVRGNTDLYENTPDHTDVNTIDIMMNDFLEFVRDDDKPLSTAKVLKFTLLLNKGDLKQALYDSSFLLKGFARRKMPHYQGWNPEHLSITHQFQELFRDEFSPISSFNDLPLEMPTTNKGAVNYDFALPNQIGTPYHAFHLAALSTDFKPEVLSDLLVGEYMSYYREQGARKALTDACIMERMYELQRLFARYQ